MIYLFFQPDNSVLTVGMEGGLLSIQHRNKEARKQEEKQKESRKRKATTTFRKQAYKVQEVRQNA